jgi:HPt (histidine-containing phosphotransfer) domain-containing protein
LILFSAPLEAPWLTKEGYLQLIESSNLNDCCIDITGLQRRFGAERTVNLLRLFITESDTRISELKRGVEERSAPVVCMVAHSLKGVSSMLRASRIETLCRSIEQYAQRSEWDLVNVELVHLEEEFIGLRKRFDH